MQRQGYVALLDVLGFSALISGDTGSERVSQYLQSLEETLQGGHTPSDVDYVVFSDSIVLTTGESEDELLGLLSACSRLFGAMLKHDIAIRGAISYGSYLRESMNSGVFVAGRPIIDAYDFEKKQDWVGIILTPSVLRRVPEIGQRCEITGSDAADEINRFRQRIKWSAFVQRCKRIPFQGGDSEECSFDGFAIVPSGGVAEPGQMSEAIDGSVSALRWLKSLAPDPRSQQKYNVPIAWLTNLRDRWSSFERIETNMRQRLANEASTQST